MALISARRAGWWRVLLSAERATRTRTRCTAGRGRRAPQGAGGRPVLARDRRGLAGPRRSPSDLRRRRGAVQLGGAGGDPMNPPHPIPADRVAGRRRLHAGGPGDLLPGRRPPRLPRRRSGQAGLRGLPGPQGLPGRRDGLGRPGPPVGHHRRTHPRRTRRPVRPRTLHRRYLGQGRWRLEHPQPFHRQHRIDTRPDAAGGGERRVHRLLPPHPARRRTSHRRRGRRSAARPGRARGRAGRRHRRRRHRAARARLLVGGDRHPARGHPPGRAPTLGHARTGSPDQGVA